MIKTNKISNFNVIYFSVIIPAYNEEKRLPETLEKIDQYLSKQPYNYEILVVNDGSNDKTAEVVEKLKLKIVNLRLINNKNNNGKGYAVRQGVIEAKGEYRLFTDADNSTSIKQIEKMWPFFKKNYEIVIGSRDVKGAVLDPSQPFFRRFTGKAFKLIRKIIVGLWEVEDSQCGFKCFTKKVAKDVFPKCQINRFSFDPEILLIAKKMGYKIKEVPVYWKNDPESRVKFKSMIEMLIDLIKIKFSLAHQTSNRQKS